MQGIGFISVNERNIAVFYQHMKHGKALKLRGKSNNVMLGGYLREESEYLKERPELVNSLLNGETIQV